MRRFTAIFGARLSPQADWVQNVLNVLKDSDGLTVRKMKARLNLRHNQIEKVLKFLAVENPAPVIKVDNQWRRTPVFYKLDAERIRRLTEQREVEWEEVKRYISERGCLMEFLAKALDDPQPSSLRNMCHLPGQPCRWADIQP